MIIESKSLQPGMTVSSFYEKQYNQFKQSVKSIEEQFPAYRPMDVLNDPNHWFEALALLEYAIDSGHDVAETQDFFEWIFKGFDCNASVDLNADEYAWYWSKIHHIIDKFTPQCPDILVEKALQYYSTRRDFINKEKTLVILEDAVNRGSDDALTILGYYVYFGFCGPKDEKKGLELMDSARSERGKGRTKVYKGYIAIYENRLEDAASLFTEVESESNDSLILRMAKELKAFLYDLQDKQEEALQLYNEILDLVPSGFAMMRMGFLYYNKQNEKTYDPQKALLYMEQSFRYGRPDVIRSLYYCYFESGEEWQDDEKAIDFLHKGYLYYDEFSTWQLACIYLFNEKHKDEAKGLKLLDEAIAMEYTEAFITKAYLLFIGEIINEDKHAAVNLLEKAAELGSANACYRLGSLHDNGEISEDGQPDYEKAIGYFEKAAERNDASACDYCGRYYLYGLGVETNAEKAKEYYEKGRQLGSPYSIVELALMYNEGNGVEEDLVKSFELLKESVAYNYTHGQYLLGRCYRYGLGTDEDPDKAVEFFQLASEQQHAKAMAELALCYEYGEGVEANGPKAFELMKDAAEQEYAYAQYKTGCYYVYGMEGFPTDYPEGFKWLSKAAENDYPYAMLELGDFFLYDYEGKEEYEKAYSYYEAAARQGIVNEGLGVCLEYGYGTEVNEGEAFKYYLKGAEDGYIRAMYYTGLCYYFGTGIKENQEEAFRWFNDAANQGHISASYYKGKMLLDGEGCTMDQGEGIRLLQQAAENDISHAQFDLANCYLTGKGVDENEDLAMEWFEKAADNGHEKALKITGRRKRK